MVSGRGRFKASWWLPGGHSQTLWPVLTRRVSLNARTERIELPDGDFLRVDWVNEKSSGPIVIVLPGLQGDIDSAYVRGILRQCESRGWRGLAMNYRGHGEPNRFKESYHCGMTTDLDFLVRRIIAQEPGVTIGLVGYSVGANICLRWLGECGRAGERLPVAAAVAVSAPFNLGVVAKKIESGLSRIYQWYLLRSLRRDVARKMKALGDDFGISRRELRGMNTFYKFDDRISGPWHGFRNAEDYYSKTRSDKLLGHVSVPTLIVNATDDPFVPAHLIPSAEQVSDKVTLEVTDGGGHLGFVAGRWPWSQRYWLDSRVPEFLEPHLGRDFANT